MESPGLLRSRSWSSIYEKEGLSPLLCSLYLLKREEEKNNNNPRKKREGCMMYGLASLYQIKGVACPCALTRGCLRLTPSKKRGSFLYFKPFLNGLQSMYHFLCAFTQNMANGSKIVSRGEGFPDFVLSESQFD